MKRESKRHILVEHYLEFYNRAVAILDDADDAKDAVQDAMVKTLVAVGVKDPVAYCYRATVNRCISMLRHKRLTVRLEDMKLLTSYDEDEIVRLVQGVGIPLRGGLYGWPYCGSDGGERLDGEEASGRGATEND